MFFINWYTHGILPGERRMVHWDSIPVPIFLRKLIRNEWQLLHRELLKAASALYGAIIRRVRQGTSQSYTVMQVMTITTLFGLSSLAQALASWTFFHQQVAARANEMSQDHPFKALVSKSCWTSLQLSICVKVAHALAAPQLIIYNLDERASQTLKIDTDIAYYKFLINAVQYTIVEDRKIQITLKN